MNVFVGNIIVAGFSIQPRNYAYCNGQLLAINQNQALFALLGTYFGGNGVNNFALPNLQGRAALGIGNYQGTTYNIGQTAGEAQHTLTVPEMPLHNHLWQGNSANANSSTPAGQLLSTANLYLGSSDGTTMAANQIANNGGSQPHENRSPYLVLNFLIALNGIFPTRN